MLAVAMAVRTDLNQRSMLSQLLPGEGLSVTFVRHSGNACGAP
jgi:hypothetical protein